MATKLLMKVQNGQKLAQIVQNFQEKTRMPVNPNMKFINNNKLVTDEQMTIDSLGLQPYSTIQLAGPMLYGGMLNDT